MSFTTYSSSKEYYPIYEAYRMICEDVEGKNINKAEKYIKQNHANVIGMEIRDGIIATPRTIINEIRNLIPNSRLADCKFLTGVTRIFLEDMQDDTDEFQRISSALNNYLKLIVSSHLNEYDNNLNGLSFLEIENRFKSVNAASISADMKDIDSKTYEKNHRYSIVRIDSFEESKKYGDYVDWCVTYDENAFNNYTHGGFGIFYFCLRDDFKTVERKITENCPLDDYGLSMIAVSVNEDGSLNTCTSRWNHENNGNDSMMTTQEISNLLGVNFYKTFIPRSSDEQWAKYQEMAYTYDAISVALDAIRIKDKYGKVSYVKREENGKINVFDAITYLDKDFTWCGIENPSIIEYTALCGDHIYWFDRNGHEIPPPDIMRGNLCIDNKQCTSLEGCPKRIVGVFMLYNVPRLTSLKGYPEFVTAATINAVNGISNLEGIGRCSDVISIKKCRNIETLKGNITDAIENFEILHCPKLTSLKYSPKWVTAMLNIRYNNGLTSLDDAPISLNSQVVMSNDNLPAHKRYNYSTFCSTYNNFRKNGMSRPDMLKQEVVMINNKTEDVTVIFGNCFNEHGKYKEIL